MEHKIDGQFIYEDMVLGTVPASVIDRVKDFAFDGDTLVVSYPKTGTKWLQEMVWLVCNSHKLGTEYTQDTMTRIPFLELVDFSTRIPILDTIQNVLRPAIFKSHLPARFYKNQLEEITNKFIVIGRNPKDTLVSFYNFYRSNALLGNFKGSWDEFFEMFMAKKLMYGDFFKWYESWWMESERRNVLFMKYEDMKKNLEKEVGRIAMFLGKSLSDSVVRQIAEHGDFDNMKKNRMTNGETLPVEVLDPNISPFMRCGKVGDWKNYFSTKQSDIVDKMCDLHLKPIGLVFEFE